MPKQATDLKPEGAKKYGKCPSCEEMAWLFPYEGTYVDPNDLMCEACIEEFHVRVHEAEDAMADSGDVDTDDSWMYDDPETYDDSQDWGGF